MGADHSRFDEDFDDYEDEDTAYEIKSPTPSEKPAKDGSSVGVKKLGSRLYKYSSGSEKWVVVDKQASWSSTQRPTAVKRKDEDEGDEEFYDPQDEDGGGGDMEEDLWFMRVAGHVVIPVSERMSTQFLDAQQRVDFHSGQAVWALRFGSRDEYGSFVQQYRDCLFENTYGMEATAGNRVKALGKDFVHWASGEDGEGAVWEDAKEDLSDGRHKGIRESEDEGDGEGVQEVHERTPAGKKPLGLTMGALRNSYLLHSHGVDVYQNSQEGIHTEGLSLSFAKLGLKDFEEAAAGAGSHAGAEQSPGRKALLMRGETTMLLMTPQQQHTQMQQQQQGRTPATAPAWRSSRLQQVDLQAERVVSEWRFEKDGAELRMLDVVGDNKAAQLDPARSTFLGLDANQLCRWDMRDRHGKVQTIASSSSSSAASASASAASSSVALTWSEGHQFARGTNFTCFATTGDGCVAVGDAKGAIRLYSTTTMRQAKTAFPGLGAPITAIDVTFDGRWVLATTDKYLLLICTAFKDKSGEGKSAFKARAGEAIAAPRILKLKPQHSLKAGPNYKFHEARFSWVTESDRPERSIVAAVTEYSVVWSFRRVKQQEHRCYSQHSSGTGIKTCTCYRVLPRSESVIDSKFMHDNYSAPTLPNAPLVVATPHEISSLRFSDA